VALTVTDDGGLTHTATASVTVVDPSQAGNVAFRAVAASNTNTAAPRVTVPAAVQAGDVMVLIASTNSSSPTVTGPAGWTALGSVVEAAAGTQTSGWWKVATAADANASVGPSLTSIAKTALHVIAYSNASGVSASGVDIDTVLGTARTTPTVPVARAGSRLVSYWADKSSASTGWLLPATVTERNQTIGTGGGLMAAAIADSGPLDPGNAGGHTATSTAAPHQRGIIWSIVIAPPL
jgi:hypothetical protein